MRYSRNPEDHNQSYRNNDRRGNIIGYRSRDDNGYQQTRGKINHYDYKQPYRNNDRDTDQYNYEYRSRYNRDRDYIDNDSRMSDRRNYPRDRYEERAGMDEQIPEEVKAMRMTADCWQEILNLFDVASNRKTDELAFRQRCRPKKL